MTPIETARPAGSVSVSEAVETRRSVRAFLDRQVDPQLIRTLIEKAVRAPSGGNLQPWHLHVVAGTRLEALRETMRERVVAAPKGEGLEYEIYPPKLKAPYRDRRFALGEIMYESLALPRDDKEGRAAWFARNFDFFGAPLALFCYVDRQQGPPQWSDLGMFLQTFMLLLREAGLDSCPQECWSIYAPTVSAFLGTSPDQLLFSGMAIGWRDPEHPVNRFAVPRAPVDEILQFHVE